jgi:hypothetical protein
MIAGAQAGAPVARAQEQTLPAPVSPRAPTYNPGASTGLRLAGAPPEPGAVVVESGLSTRGLIPAPVGCVTGLGGADFTAEGYRLQTSGKCGIESTYAGVQTPVIPGLELLDGEVRFDLKAANGHERASAYIWLRLRVIDDCGAGYLLELRPGTGAAGLVRFQDCGQGDVLASRSDLCQRFARAEWSAIAVRLDGPRIWALLNGEPFISAADSTIDRGGLAFGIARLGDLADEEQSAIVLRDLRVSALAQTLLLPIAPELPRM